MSIEKIQLELKSVIERTQAAEVVGISSRNGDVRLLFRVTDEDRWFKILNVYLKRQSRKYWYSHIGKKFFWSGKQDIMGFLWVYIIEDDDLNTTIQEIRKLWAAAITEVGGKQGIPEKKGVHDLFFGGAGNNEISSPMPWDVPAPKTAREVEK